MYIQPPIDYGDLSLFKKSRTRYKRKKLSQKLIKSRRAMVRRSRRANR